MTLLLMLLLKSLLVFACAGAALLCLRRASSAARHLVCLLTLVSLLALPLFSIALPGWHLPVLETQEIPLAPNNGGTGFRTAPAKLGLPPVADKSPGSAVASGKPGLAFSTPPSSAPAPPSLGVGGILALYLIGLLLASIRPLLGLWGIRRLQRLCTDVRDAPTRAAATDCAALLRLPPPRLCLSDVPMPMTWGGRRPVVLLPDSSVDWPEDRLRSVLLHEMAHIKRRDWSFHRFADLVCALYWFHPLVWLTARRLRTESELACDDLVLASGVPAPDYARHLLEIAGSRRPASPGSQTAIAMAQTSRIEGRLRMILDSTLRRNLSRRALMTAFVLGTAAFMPIAVLQPTAKARTSSAVADAVQIVGIADTSGTQWGTDGKPLSAPAFHQRFWKTYGSVSATPGNKIVFLAFHLPQSSTASTPLVFDIPDAASSGVTEYTPHFVLTARRFQFQTVGNILCATAFPASLTQTDIRIGHTFGPWKTAATIHAPFNGEYSITNSIGSQHTSTKLIIARGKILFTDQMYIDQFQSFQIVDVDKAEKRFVLHPTIETRSDNRKQITMPLPQPLSHIRELCVETRPFVWTEFKNVALQPASTAPAVSPATVSPLDGIPPQDYDTPWTSQVTKSYWQPQTTYHFALHIAPGREGMRPDPPVNGKLVYGPGQASNFSVQVWKPGRSNFLTVKFDYTPKVADKVHPDIIHLLTKQGTVAGIITYYSL